MLQNHTTEEATNSRSEQTLWEINRSLNYLTKQKRLRDTFSVTEPWGQIIFIIQHVCSCPAPLHQSCLQETPFTGVYMGLMNAPGKSQDCWYWLWNVCDSFVFIYVKISQFCRLNPDSGVKVLHCEHPPSTPASLLATRSTIHKCSSALMKNSDAAEHNPGRDYVCHRERQFSNMQTSFLGDGVALQLNERQENTDWHFVALLLLVCINVCTD